MNTLQIISILLAVFFLPSISHSTGEKNGWWAGDEDKQKEWQNDNWKSKEQKNGANEKWDRKQWQGRFVPQGKEKELLDLLQQLDTPQSNEKQVGGKSEIQRKIFIVRKLRKFDDCRAEEALKKLSEEEWCEDRGGDQICGQWEARAGMEETKSIADLKKLSPETSLAEQETIIAKYSKHPYINDFAARKIKQYLVEQAAAKPEFYVVLLVEKFPQDTRSEMLLRQHPELIPKTMTSLLQSSNPTDVWWGISLVRSLEQPDFLEKSVAVSFQKSGNIDYSDTEQVKTIQSIALGYCRDFEYLAVPCYRAALNSDFPEIREAVINGLRHPDNPDMINLFQEFYNDLTQHSSPANNKLAERIQKAVVFPGNTEQ